MLVLMFFRFLSGYVEFNAWGGFSERFLNLCRINKINLWNLKCKNSVITACTDCSGYKKIRNAAKKSGMKMRIKQKHGLPFFLNKHSHRAGVILGICTGIAMICILSTRIWSIDVTGNVRVPAEKITGVFEELGVKKGVSGNGIDIKSVEIEALRRLPEISWLNINVEGSAARIEVRETAVMNEADESETPTDIVAARDGQIVILRPFNGTQEQKIGNPVLKGDLLISGIEENKDLTISFCRARGYVVARTKRKVETKQKSVIDAFVEAETKTTYIIEFLNFSIPLGRADENAYREKSEVMINGVTLPLGITRCIGTDRAKKEIRLSAEQTELLAKAEFFRKCVEEFKYLKTESGEITVNADENETEIKGEFMCLENIGKEIPMDIEETE